MPHRLLTPLWLAVLLALAALATADFRSRYALQSSAAYKGIAYSAFLHEGPEPEGHHEPLLPENIERDMAILEQYKVRWIRTYATDLNGSLIPSIAKKHGIDTFVGTWVNAGDDGVEFWRQELARAEEVFKNDDQLVPIIILGNELAYTKKQPLATILKMIQEAKAKGFYVAMGDIPPSFLDPVYAPVWEAADVLLVHSHPYFSHIRTSMGVRVMGTRLMPDAAGADDVVQATLKIMETFPNKLVLIGETGYPSEDDSPALSPAKCRWCSPDNQRHFLEALLHLAGQKQIGVFAFEAFDEHWKGDVGEEAGSGPHWGFWDADRVPKPAADVVAKWVQADVLPAPAHPCEYIALQAECRPKDTVDQAGLGGMLDFTCTDGVVDCEELEKNPLLVGCPAKAKASWALTKYFQQNLWRDSACDFGGTASPHFAEGVVDTLRASDTLRVQIVRTPPAVMRFAAENFMGGAPVRERPQPREGGGAVGHVGHPLLSLVAVALVFGAAAWGSRTGRLAALLQHTRYREYLEV